MPDKLRLVLMSCCAPCSAGAIKQLANGEISGIDDFIVLFFNPNIFPTDEYDRRLAEQVRYCEKLGVKYAIGEYDHAAWRNAVRGMENAPERGPRCSACFRFRFEYAKKWAAEHGYNAISSVFGVSRHKDQSQVDRAGCITLSDKYMPIKWDEQLRIAINKTADFYRQKYCGCEFSIRPEVKKAPNQEKFVLIR